MSIFESSLKFEIWVFERKNNVPWVSNSSNPLFSSSVAKISTLSVCLFFLFLFFFKPRFYSYAPSRYPPVKPHLSGIRTPISSVRKMSSIRYYIKGLILHRSSSLTQLRKSLSLKEKKTNFRFLFSLIFQFLHFITWKDEKQAISGHFVYNLILSDILLRAVL